MLDFARAYPSTSLLLRFCFAIPQLREHHPHLHDATAKAPLLSFVHESAGVQNSKKRVRTCNFASRLKLKHQTCFAQKNRTKGPFWWTLLANSAASRYYPACFVFEHGTENRFNYKIFGTIFWDPNPVKNGPFSGRRRHVNSGLPPRALLRVGVQFPMIQNISLSGLATHGIVSTLGWGSPVSDHSAAPSPSTWRSAQTTLPSSSPMALVFDRDSMEISSTAGLFA